MLIHPILAYYVSKDAQENSKVSCYIFFVEIISHEREKTNFTFYKKMQNPEDMKLGRWFSLTGRRYQFKQPWRQLKLHRCYWSVDPPPIAKTSDLAPSLAWSPAHLDWHMAILLWTELALNEMKKREKKSTNPCYQISSANQFWPLR